MTVAIDTDSAPPREGGDVAVDRYVRELVGSLLSGGGPVDRIVLLTNAENHARFETLRDEHCDVAMVHRPLFEGRPVEDWSALLARYPTSGAELLSGHLQEKLRIVRELGAAVVHLLADPPQAMPAEAPVVVSLLGESAVSSTLAHAVIVPAETVKEQLCAGWGVSREKVFVAPWAGETATREASSIEAGVADDSKGREAFAAAVCEAYEHALASFELRNAA
jgi:hypothetical protein